MVFNGPIVGMGGQPESPIVIAVEPGFQKDDSDG